MTVNGMSVSVQETDSGFIIMYDKGGIGVDIRADTKPTDGDINDYAQTAMECMEYHQRRQTDQSQ